MGMRPIDIIAIVGKTHDATHAMQASARAHDTTQDQIAVRQATLADRASEQVNATPDDDRLELSTDGSGGNGAGGGDTSEGSPGEAEEELDDRIIPLEHQIDFLA